MAYIGAGASDQLVGMLGDGDTVVCDASDMRVASGVTAPRVLRRLVDAGVEVYSNEDLHAKVYVGRSGAVVASGNLSTRALGNLEAGAWLADEQSVAAARSFVLGLRIHMRSTRVDTAFLDRADIIYRPTHLGGTARRSGAERLRIQTYGQRAPVALARFADAHTPQAAEGSLVDWSWGTGRDWRVGDLVVWVQRDSRLPQAIVDGHCTRCLRSEGPSRR